MVKQLKNRYNDLASNKRFVIGVDRNKMRLFDVDASAQKNIVQDDTKTSTKPSFTTSKSFARTFEGFKL